MSKLKQIAPFLHCFLQQTQLPFRCRKKKGRIDTQMFKSHTVKQAIVYIERLYLPKAEGKK